jgi:hypothetical protein
VRLTTEQERAHLRLTTELRSRIRQHEWQPVVKLWGYKRTAAEQRLLAERLRAMQSAGLSRKQMMAQTNCTTRTLINILGRVK